MAQALAQLTARGHHADDDDLVFISRGGVYVDLSPFRRRFGRALKAAGITRPVRVHDLRHGATTDLRSVFTVDEVQKLVGHKDARTAQRYAHPRSRRDAAKLWTARLDDEIGALAEAKAQLQRNGSPAPHLCAEVAAASFQCPLSQCYPEEVKLDDSTENPQPDASTLTCFVIGPIGNPLAEIGSPGRETYEESLRVVEEVIKPACAAVGLNPVRADEISVAGEINEQIFRRLRDDDVVIADLTNANANVMYELGLRHTKDRITIQIGEFERLPFDITQIRTVQFSASTMGRVDARGKLTTILEAALAGEFEAVTATRVWNETSNGEPPAEDEPLSPPPPDDDRGFLDVLADAEEGLDQVVPALEAISAHIEQVGQLSNRSTEEIAASDNAGKGMKGRLAVMTRYAAALDAMTPKLEADLDHYETVLRDVVAGNLALVGRLEDDPSQLEVPEGRDFALVMRRMAATARESMAETAGMVASIRENAQLSKVLRAPSQRLVVALTRFSEVNEVMDELDRRLQILGVPVPPEDWEPEFDETDAD